MKGGFLHRCAIRGVFQRGGLGAVHLAREAGHPYPRGSRHYEGNAVEFPRLIVVLAGARPCRLVREGVATEILAAAGDAVFVAPRCWLVTFLEDRFTSIVISFLPTLTRYCLSTFDVQRARDRRARYPLKEFGSRYLHPRTMDREGLSACDLLLATRDRPADDPVLRQLAGLMLLKAGEHLQSGGPETFSKAYLHWQAACQFIEGNCHRPLSRSDVAAHLHVHPSHLSRLFMENARQGFTEYLRDARLRRAQLLLKDSDLTVTDVAALSGFTSQSYFNRVFAQAFGHPPGRARALAKVHRLPRAS
jgi:AraC-like DNA-binding protein